MGHNCTDKHQEVFNIDVNHKLHKVVPNPLRRDNPSQDYDGRRSM